MSHDYWGLDRKKKTIEFLGDSVGESVVGEEEKEHQPLISVSLIQEKDQSELQNFLDRLDKRITDIEQKFELIINRMDAQQEVINRNIDSIADAIYVLAQIIQHDKKIEKAEDNSDVQSKIIVLKPYTKEEAQKAVLELLQSEKEELYMYQIAEKLGMDLKIVATIIKELEAEGKIE